VCVCCVRKYIRVLLIGETDAQLRLSDWRLETDSDDVTLVCLNNKQDHFVRHV